MPVWRDYNPTNDLVFKFVFGRPERKNVTLAFINDVLGREGDAAFVDLEYRNVEFAPLRESEKLGCRKVNDVTPEKIIRKRPHR